jgi:NAD(P)H-dependent FMN reductase
MNTCLQIVIGSTRPGRKGGAVGAWFHDLAVRHDRFDVELIDLCDIDLPLLDEPRPAGRGPYTKTHTRQWSQIVSAGSAYVFVVPEYNHSYNAATKNALDFLSAEWRDKPVGFVGYGGSAGGARAVQALTPVVVALGMRPLARSVHIPLINRAVTAEGTLRADERLDTNALMLLDELRQHVTPLAEKGNRQNVVLEPSFGDRGRGTEQGTRA